jgi:hypothetical protein
VIAAVRVVRAVATLLFDVHHFPVSRQLEIPADDAAAGERGKTEKSNETHG